VVAPPAEQPQLPPEADSPQHSALSLGSQQVACASVEQQDASAPSVVFNSVRSATRKTP
jgi:hypothetical protein